MYRKPHRRDAVENVRDSLFVVQGGHGSISIGIVGETNETETPAAARVTVFYDDLSKCKQFCHFFDD
jgi:hypothetical protein